MTVKDTSLDLSYALKPAFCRCVVLRWYGAFGGGEPWNVGGARALTVADSGRTIGESRTHRHTMQFLKISDYVLNLPQVSDIDQEDPKSWVVYMASGREYTLEGADLKSFKAATGL